jgi:hypothetical protein
MVLRMTVAIKGFFAALLPKQVFSVPTSEIVRNGFVAGREAVENERVMKKRTSALVLLAVCAADS